MSLTFEIYGSMEWYLSTLRVSNADRIFNNFTIDVFGVNLFPKDRRIVL